ncbi:pectinesterase/pectinesterase inhibitor 7 [Spatholobus suberectus]|nr:pectinesterase/pectinesterase inhibitor 7 [Spatholobus suberectus]
MALKYFSILTFSISYLLSFLVLASLSIADTGSPSIVPPETICGSTVDPTYCKTELANQNGNVFDYGRISFRKSMSQARKFLNLVDSYLQGSSSLSQYTIGALQDCRFLAGQSLGYLSNVYATANQASGVLPTSQAEDFETYLSAVLTNQQTCLDGLQSTPDARVKNNLSSSLSDDSKLHSVTLALFLKGWVPAKKIMTSWPQNGRHLNFKNGRLPLKMSDRVRAIYDSARHHGRKLLQTVNKDQSVVVSDIVVVSQDGSGNFTTINDAIAAAPNNSAASDGYFLIFITGGVYQEYVSINKTKTYLMLVGDGINQTIITGNHSVGDNFTTFNSATVGKQI